MVKQRGQAAIRWQCDTCTRSAVDAGPASPTSSVDLLQWPLCHLLPWCTVRLASPTAEAAAPSSQLAHVYVGDVHAWSLPWPLARWLRDSVIASQGVVSETVCAAALFAWCEGRVCEVALNASVASVSELDSTLPRPWHLVLGPAGGTPFSIRAACGTSIACGSSSVPPAPPTTAFTPLYSHPVQRHSSGAAVLLESDDSVAAASLAAVISDLYAPGFSTWLLQPSRRERSAALQPATALVTPLTAAADVAAWLSHGPTASAASSAWSKWPVAGQGPWPQSWYPPVPLWDRTACPSSQDPPQPSWSNVVATTLPLLQCPVRPGVTTLDAHAWWRALDGHPHQSFLWLGISYGFPILVSPERAPGGARAVQRTIPAPAAAQVSAFVAKERAARHMLGVVDDGLIVWPADTLWVAPIVTAPKPGGSPGEVRVCHHASAAPKDSALPPLNDDITFHAIAPVGLLHLSTVVQRIRQLTADAPGRRIGGAKADAKAFFRQFPLRQRDWAWMAHCWLGVVIIHIVLSFGLRSAVHVSCALSNAISDIMQVVLGIWVAFFVDDGVLINYASELDADYAWLLAIGTALGLVWNSAKHVPPCSALDVLGVWFDLRTLRASITPAKRATLLAAVDRLLQAAADGRSVRLADIRQVAGLMYFLGAIVPWGRAHTAPLWRLCGDDVTHASPFRRLNQESVFALRWWRVVANGDTILSDSLDVGISPPRALLPLYYLRTDASSKKGFGAAVFVQPGWWCQGRWNDRERLFSINVLELAAIVFGVACNPILFTGGILVVESDNLTAVWSIWSESSRQAPLRLLTLLLCYIQAKFKFVIRVRHVPGQFMLLVDAISRMRPFRHLLPSGPGWAWSECLIPPSVRLLGQTEPSGLLYRTSPGQSLVPPQPSDTWIRTWLTDVVEACPGISSISATTALPFLPYLPTGAPVSISSFFTV